jgi:hypothetical protein
LREPRARPARLPERRNAGSAAAADPAVVTAWTFAGLPSEFTGLEAGADRQVSVASDAAKGPLVSVLGGTTVSSKAGSLSSGRVTELRPIATIDTSTVIPSAYVSPRVTGKATVGRTVHAYKGSWHKPHKLPLPRAC